MILFHSFVERSNNTFNMSIWHGGKMSNSEYAGTPSLSKQYSQWLTLRKITPYNHMKESHFYISDDRTHDIHYVQHCFKLFYDHMIAMDIPFYRHIIWSDGCAGQFKNAHVFECLCLLHLKYKVPHVWN